MCVFSLPRLVCRSPYFHFLVPLLRIQNGVKVKVGTQPLYLPMSPSCRGRGGGGMGLWLTQQKCHPAVPSAVSWLPGSSGEVCPSSSRNSTSQALYATVRMSLVADLLLTLLPRNDCSMGHSPPTLSTPPRNFCSLTLLPLGHVHPAPCLRIPKRIGSDLCAVYAGKCLTTGPPGEISPDLSICQSLWCKYSYQG